jgi:hypothetical protein
MKRRKGKKNPFGCIRVREFARHLQTNASQCLFLQTCALLPFIALTVAIVILLRVGPRTEEEEKSISPPYTPAENLEVVAWEGLTNRNKAP